LFRNGHIPQALFFAHLAVEKKLKARVLMATQQNPPYIHNLARLVELGCVDIPNEFERPLELLNRWQARARYGAYPTGFKLEEAEPLLEFAEEFIAWLDKQQ